MKPRVGDIFEVPLPNGRFAYGKVFRDASVGIYETVFDAPERPPIKSAFSFVVGLYEYILADGVWPIVGHEPFDSTDAEWPPPYFINDAISGDYSRYPKASLFNRLKLNVGAWNRRRSGTLTTLSAESLTTMVVYTNAVHAQQIVGHERRGRVSHHSWSGDT